MVRAVRATEVPPILPLFQFILRHESRFAVIVKIQPHYRTLSGNLRVSVRRLRISSVPTANL